jgi:methionyl-tRNA formyltransferase
MDWSKPAQVCWNQVRGLVPWPGAYTFLPAAPHPLMLKVWKAEVLDETGVPGTVLSAGKTGIVVGCGTGSLRLLQLQREGGRRLSAAEFLAGCHIARGLSFITPISQSGQGQT